MASSQLKVFAPPHLQEEARQLVEKHHELSGYLFATSGTTGTPQWILHSQEGLDWCARTVNDHFECTAQDIWGLALPLFHVGGYCLTHRARMAGGKVTTLEGRWQPNMFRQWLEREKVSIVSLVPTQVFDLVREKLTPPPNLRLALVGGEHLPAATFEKASELGWPLRSSYGMTETAGLIAASGLGNQELQPLPGWTLACDQAGLLTIDGPSLFQGHLSDHEFLPAPRPFTTRDLVEKEGNTLRILGRSDDQVKILGELVDLASLRQELAAEFPDWRSTVLAIPEERRGHVLLAVIEGQPNSFPHHQFQRWNQDRPGFARCEDPVFVSKWPRSPLGKLDLRTLSRQVTDERTSLLHKKRPPA